MLNFKPKTEKKTTRTGGGKGWHRWLRLAQKAPDGKALVRVELKSDKWVF